MDMFKCLYNLYFYLFQISYVDFEFYVYLEMIRFLDEDYLRGHEKLKAYIQRFEVRHHSFNSFFAN